MTFTIVLIVLALILFWAIGAYKRLRRLHRQSRTAFLQLEAQLTRRHQLVADLTDAAKDEALIAVMSAHSYAVNAGIKAQSTPSDAAAVRAMSAAEVALSSALGDVSAWALEHSPKIAIDLENIEQSLAFAWHTYNHTAALYNESVQQFPVSLIAALFAFRSAPLL